MFGYSVGVSATADVMALFSILINSRWRHRAVIFAIAQLSCLAYRTNNRAYATVLRLSVVVCTERIVAKRCEQKLLLTAYRKSETVRDRGLVPKDHQ